MYRDENDVNDADDLQADLEAASRGARQMRRLLRAGHPADAARACHHGSGYPTNSPAASGCADPRAGQPGHRCTECGSYWRADQFAHVAGRFSVPLSALRQIAPIAPCELPPD